MVHPLLKAPVANDLHWQSPGLLVTGSNMSGKSTFLRTVGLNLLLAQTFNFCLAQSYQAPFLHLVTSIGRSDNIIQGESYYLDEAKSILRIVENSAQRPVLAILDEIFRGTNSAERIAIAHHLLTYLAQKGGRILVASHDLELTQLLAGPYVNMHFREEVGEKGLTFDYQLRTGPSQTRNAIHLLAFLGYPQEVIEGAKRDVQPM